MSIFQEQIARRPDRYPWASEFISSMWQSHWTPDEFNFQSDIQDFKINLNTEEKNIVKNTLSAIGQIEIAVKKFWAKLGDNLPHPSLVDLGLVMASVEVIHNKAYEKLLDVLGLQQVFEENLKLDIIQGRVNYLRKYLHKYYKDSKKQYLYSLILFTLFIENVSLFSQFYIILWFNRFRNVLKDTSQQVNYTKNEEMIHAQVGIKLVNVIRKEHPELFDEELEEKVQQEALAAFEAESKIIDWMLGSFNEETLNKELLKEYVKNRINGSLKAIKFKKPFKINKELISKTDWIEEETYGNQMTDFFYKRPVDYSKSVQVINGDELF
mgnify:CR=1 FL=1